MPHASFQNPAVRAKLRLRKAAVPVERLRAPKIGWLLIDAWTQAIRRPRP